LKATHSKIASLESRAKINGLKNVLDGTSTAEKTQAAKEEMQRKAAEAEKAA